MVPETLRRAAAPAKLIADCFDDFGTPILPASVWIGVRSGWQNHEENRF
jgi:hypothetical protein